MDSSGIGIVLRLFSVNLGGHRCRCFRSWNKEAVCIGLYKRKVGGPACLGETFSGTLMYLIDPIRKKYT